MEVLKKIFEARKQIKASDLKKAGRNDYSKYDYYTPEQVDKLVHDACIKLNLLNMFQLKRTELGLMAEIEVIDLDSGKSRVFESATEIPEITATNISQQLGGCMTYSNRYLLMFIYDIVDNNLDFDAKKPSENKKEKTEDERPWLSDKQFSQAIERIKTNLFEEGQTADEFFKRLKSEFRMKKTYSEQLTAQLEFTKKLI